MVAKEDQYHRLVQLLQSLGQLRHRPDRPADSVQVVVQNIAARLRQAGPGGGEIGGPVGGGVGVGAVVLVGDREGKARPLGGPVLQLPQQLLDQQRSEFQIAAVGSTSWP